MDQEFDLLIKDATIVDGSGKPAYKGSIGVIDECVASVGKVKGEAKEVIDASGLTATPGFVDAHSHADLTILWYPKAENFVMQGVTTFVGGQCGDSPAPLGDFVCVPWLLEDYLDELAPHKYYPPEPVFPLETVNKWMKDKFGWTMDWRTIGEYFTVVEEKGISCNYAPLVGQGAIRYVVMGKDYKRTATKSEVDQMIKLIHQAMEEGCIGMSAGLDYDPSVFADEEEITKCVSVLKKYGAIYAPHWKRTGRRRDIPMGTRPIETITSITECIQVSRKTGVSLQLAHLYGGYHVTPQPPPVLQEAIGKATLNVIDRARAEGLDVNFDVIPYSPSGYPLPYLCSLLAPWLRELGSREKLAEWLKVPDYRNEVKEAIFAGKWFISVAYNPNTNPHWAENITVLKSKRVKYEGKTLAKIAAEQGKDPINTWFDIVAEDPDTRGAVPDYRGTEEYVKLFFKHPAGMVGVDTIVCDDKREQKSPPYMIPEVNTYAAYPSFLIRYVREQKLFTIEDAVQKVATLPAKVYKLKGRGVIETGAFADIVLMDFPHLKVLGDALEPRRYPEGIEYVFVNGTAVVKKGKHTGATPGKVLGRR